DPALLFDAAAPEAIGEGIVAFLERLERDEAAIARLRHAARLHAERRYSWTRAIDALEAELARLVAGTTTALPAAACEACGALRGGKAGAPSAPISATPRVARRARRPPRPSRRRRRSRCHFATACSTR